MEFVRHEEALDLLRAQRIRQEPAGQDRVHLRMADDGDVVHLHLTCLGGGTSPPPNAQVVTFEKDQLGGAVEHILHKLNLNEVLLIPVGRWRRIFDAVAFSLAANEDWQQIDAAATVELNTRDPLVCGPGDFHTINALLRALFNDADSPDQALMLLTTAAPLLMEVMPEGCVRISVGSAAMADEIAEMFGRPTA